MPIAAPRPETWIRATPAGLYCLPGDFYIDPLRPVARAVITHGHGDHARPGNARVLATAATIAIMQARYGEQAGGAMQPLAYGETLAIGEVQVRLAPAGHVLGSAQIVLEYRGSRVVASGDYKRRPDPTCAPFEPLHCDLFITEATFGCRSSAIRRITRRSTSCCIRFCCFPSAATWSGSMCWANASGCWRCCGRPDTRSRFICTAR